MRNSLLLAAAAVLLSLSGCTPVMEKSPLTVGGQAFTVEIARTEAQRALGLMHRTSIGKREGMLFVFDSDEHLTFWMKDTPLPLSIAFLSAQGKILEITDMEPLSEKTIRSRFSARYALELGRGVFDEVGAKPGDDVPLPPGLK
jgi:uncharacterized protein